MRLEELRLIAYGPFTDCTLRLQPGLNVLYGPNEAGKSSALRAVQALLFGIEQRTTDNFLHSYKQLRVGGVLVDSQGRRLECVRRKGNRSTLRDGDDVEVVAEGELQAMLAGVTQEFFKSIFGFDHERLRRGGEEVIRGEGRVAELLFSAGGVAHLREKQEALQNAAADLFKPTGRNPRINLALTEAKSLRDQIRELQLSPEQWSRHDSEYRRLEEEEARLRQELATTEADKTRLGRISDAKQFVGAWKDKRAQLSELENIVVLADDADLRFREENEKQKLATAAKLDAETRVEELESAFKKLDVQEALLGEEARIDELYRRLGSHEKAAEDQGVLAGQQRTARDAAKRTIEKLGWQMSIDNAKERRVADEKKSRVRTLASRHGEVTQERSRQKSRLDRAEAQLTDLQQSLAAEENLDPPVLPRAAVASAETLLAVEGGLRSQQAEEQRLRREVEDALARLPHFSGTIDEARRLTVPGEEAVDKFEQSQRDLASESAKLADQITSNQSEQEDLTQKLQTLELHESVPTEEELTTARATRDRGIQLAVLTLEGEEPDATETASFISTVAEGKVLATSLAPSVRQADEISDRLRREASRVADKAQLIARHRFLVDKARQLDERLAGLKKQQADWDREWTSLWESSGVSPDSPPEMRGWLRRLAELIGKSDELATTSDQLERDTARIETAMVALRDELEQLGGDAPESQSLASLLAATKAKAEEVDEKRREYAELVSGVARFADEVEAAKQDLEAAEASLREWKTGWADAVAPLSLDADALPEQAEAVLTNLDELFRSLDDFDGFGARIWGINKTASEFADAAKEMAKQVAPDLSDLGAEQLVPTLNRRLDAAKQVRQQSESLDKQLESERAAVEKAERNLSESTAALEAMVAEATCGSVDDLLLSIGASRRKKLLEKEVEERERELTPLCGGKLLSEFVAEVEREDADRLPMQLEELAQQVEDLRFELDETIAARQREASELERYGGSAKAAEKAEERLSALARIEDDVREYVVATTASSLLQHAVERYQQKSQGPVLAGASEYFRLLTRGSFKALRTDYDESGREILVGVRPDGSILMIDGMSEGTRDQLYLALRLGTLGYWFEGHEPIPFVVDDVLLTFDDERTMAALEALAALAEHTQVLMFTHHEHIVSMARDSAFQGEVSLASL